jgi:hypothetical protein
MGTEGMLSPLSMNFGPGVTSAEQGGGCYTCRYFYGEYMGPHTVCRKDAAPMVTAIPKRGCAFWEREPGADDEKHRVIAQPFDRRSK